MSWYPTAQTTNLSGEYSPRLEFFAPAFRFWGFSSVAWHLEARRAPSRREVQMDQYDRLVAVDRATQHYLLIRQVANNDAPIYRKLAKRCLGLTEQALQQ